MDLLKNRLTANNAIFARLRCCVIGIRGSPLHRTFFAEVSIRASSHVIGTKKIQGIYEFCSAWAKVSFRAFFKLHRTIRAYLVAQIPNRTCRLKYVVYSSTVSTSSTRQAVVSASVSHESSKQAFPRLKLLQSIVWAVIALRANRFNFLGASVTVWTFRNSDLHRVIIW